MAKNADLQIQINTNIVAAAQDLILVPCGSMGKNVIIFEIDINLSVHIDNENKDTLILSEGPAQGLP